VLGKGRFSGGVCSENREERERERERKHIHKIEKQKNYCIGREGK